MDLRKHIDQVAERICAKYEKHADERSLIGAFNQALSDSPAYLEGAEIGFDFRNFPDQTEERQTGADGGYVVTVEKNAQQQVEKAEIYQAKRVKTDGIKRSHRMPRNEADRLRKQAKNMCNRSKKAAILVVAKRGIFVVDARQVAVARDEREPFRNARIISVGTFLGVWLARCTRGQKDPDFVDRVRNPGGFLASYLHMRIVVR